MKLFALCFLAVLGLALAETTLYPRGCIYANGRCVEECKEGTHAYSSDCGAVTPEPTCATPEPTPGRGTLCGFSACYCDYPTVRDEASGNCVLFENCPSDFTGSS